MLSAGLQLGSELNVFCMHPYFNCFPLFFLSNPYISSLPPSHSFYVPAHLHLLNSFLNKGWFFPSFVTEVTTCFCWFCCVFFFHLGYLQMENRLSNVALWYMRKLLSHSNPSMVWHFTSSHPGMLDFAVLLFLLLDFLVHFFLCPTLSHFFFLCR